MTPREQLVCYLATLFTLLAVFESALFAAGHAVTITEAFGMGTITGGLIGLLRIPSSQAPRVTATTESGDVNVPPEVKA